MRKFIVPIFLTFAFSCSDETLDLLPSVTKKVIDLHAPTTSSPGSLPSGNFIGFNLMDESPVTDNTWDIAFRGTTILINGGSKGGDDEPVRTGEGGAYVAVSTYQDLMNINVDEIKQDDISSKAIPNGSGNGWYSYDFQNHVISAIPGRTLVIKTHDGRYAKIEILCYYRGCPEVPSMESESQYFTFNYTIQPNYGLTNFD